MNITSPGRLGDRLIARGALRAEELEIALAEQRRAHRPLGEILVELGFVSDESIARVRAEDLGVEFVSAAELAPDPFLCASLGPDFVHATRSVPLGETAGRVRIALADPDDPESLARVRAPAHATLRHSSPVLSLVHTPVRHFLERCFRKRSPWLVGSFSRAFLSSRSPFHVVAFGF